ncbi:MAG: biopolymer transporter ExbD [Deltaproteobacteria bacterium]|nr:biopolymer transporter ExbD [Deltaproteobacteria bacterium]
MADPQKNTPPADQSSDMLPSTTGQPKKGGEEEGRKPRKGSRLEKHEYPLNITAMMDMMTIILVYLLKSYASAPENIQPSDDMKLAQSTTRIKPEEAVPLAITKKGILVNDKTVVPIQNGKVPAQHKEGGRETSYLISPLLAVMKAEAEKQKTIAKWNKAKDFKGLVMVIGDRMVPYRLLTEVLYTVGQAEFGQYKFAVTIAE